MESIFKKLMPVIFITLLSISLTGCSPKPDETVKGFFQALKQQDIQKASSFVKYNFSEKDLKIDKFDSKEQEKMMKAVLSKIDYSLGEVDKDGDSATAKVSVTSIDLGRISTKTINELLPTLMSQAFSQEKVDEKKQQDIVFQHMLNSINDPNALTGNFYSAAKKLQAK